MLVFYTGFIKLEKDYTLIEIKYLELTLKNDVSHFSIHNEVIALITIIIWQTKRDFPTVHRSLNRIIIILKVKLGIEAVRKSAIRLAATAYMPKHYD